MKLEKSEGRADAADTLLKGAQEKAENLQEELAHQKELTHKAELKVEDLSRKVRLYQQKIEDSGVDDGSKAALDSASKKADAVESELKGTKMKLMQAAERIEDLTEELADSKGRAGKAEMKVEDLERKVRLLQEQLESSAGASDSGASATHEKRADAMESELKGTKMKL